MIRVFFRGNKCENNNWKKFSVINYFGKNVSSFMSLSLIRFQYWPSYYTNKENPLQSDGMSLTSNDINDEKQSIRFSFQRSIYVLISEEVGKCSTFASRRVIPSEFFS